MPCIQVSFNRNLCLAFNTGAPRSGILRIQDHPEISRVCFPVLAHVEMPDTLLRVGCHLITQETENMKHLICLLSLVATTLSNTATIADEAIPIAGESAPLVLCDASNPFASGQSSDNDLLFAVYPSDVLRIKRAILAERSEKKRKRCEYRCLKEKKTCDLSCRGGSVSCRYDCREIENACIRSC